MPMVLLLAAAMSAWVQASLQPEELHVHVCKEHSLAVELSRFFSLRSPGVASYYPPTPPQSPNATPQGPSVDNVTSALDLGGGARRKAAISRRLASASHRERTRRIPNPPPPHDCIDASPPPQSWLARAWRILGSAVMNLLFLFAVIYVVVAYFFR